MKKLTLILLATLVMATTTSLAKNICTVVFSVPQMQCEGCEAKVKKNIKNLKGLKAFKIDLPKKTVSITYDSDKTTVKKLQDAFHKFNYEATVLKSSCNAGKDGANTCDGSANSCTSTSSSTPASCCGGNGQSSPSDCCE